MSISLLTLSGAHATGKSTIVADLKEAVAESTAVIDVPSTSLAWINERRKEHPEFSYDDINRLGLREQMQQDLPSILADLVRQTMLFAMSMLVRPPEDKRVDDVLIIVDRWLADMAAYTIQEITDDQKRSIALRYVQRAYYDLEMMAGGVGALLDQQVKVHHFFVHIEGTEDFQIEEKAQRATTDRLEWEGILSHVWDGYTIGTSNHIRTGDRTGRIEQCLRRLRSTHPG